MIITFTEDNISVTDLANAYTTEDDANLKRFDFVWYLPYQLLSVTSVVEACLSFVVIEAFSIFLIVSVCLI